MESNLNEARPNEDVMASLWRICTDIVNTASSSLIYVCLSFKVCALPWFVMRLLPLPQVVTVLYRPESSGITLDLNHAGKHSV